MFNAQPTGTVISRRKELGALIDTIRAICTLIANHYTQPVLHKEVDEGPRLLPLPSTDNKVMLAATVGGDDSDVRPPFVNALLEKVILSPGPFVTGGCPPAPPTPAVTTGLG